MKTLPLEELPDQRFDLAFTTCGYETRAIYLSKSSSFTATETLVLDYGCSDQLNYNQNRLFYEDLADHRFISIDESLDFVLRENLAEALSSLEGDAKLHVFFDLSSCSRSVMAKVMLAISEVGQGRTSLTCAYALSAFDTAPESELPSHISQPVIGDLSGWSDDLSKPPCAIIGLGFEPGRALGCMDYLEIPEVRLFMPLGVDTRFETAVEKANEVLISESGRNSVLPYRILDPADSYEKIESLTFGLLPQFRPVIIPLGPKIFAALAIVLAIRVLPRVCVWRTSSGNIGEITDRTASGEVAIFSTDF